MKEFLLLFRGDYQAVPQGDGADWQAMAPKWQDWIGGLTAQNKWVAPGQQLTAAGKVVRANGVITLPGQNGWVASSMGIRIPRPTQVQTLRVRRGGMNSFYLLGIKQIWRMTASAFQLLTTSLNTLIRPSPTRESH